MVINIIGDCDKRPVLYTILKVCQTLGDVLLITNSSRLSRLSDTRESYGHYQNIMIAITHEGIDDFFEDFIYDVTDFEFTVIDNIVAAEADLTIYVKGMCESEEEKTNIEYIDNYEVVELYKGKYIDAKTMIKCEEFESLKDLCPINAKIAAKIAPMLAKVLNTDPERIKTIAMESTGTYMSSLPKDKTNKKPFFGIGGF